MTPLQALALVAGLVLLSPIPYGLIVELWRHMYARTR